MFYLLFPSNMGGCRVTAELISSLLPAALESMGAPGPSEAVRAQREQLAAELDAAMGIYVNDALKKLLLCGAYLLLLESSDDL